MKRIQSAIWIVVMIASALVLCNGIYQLVSMRNGEKVDCTITFIGLPDGTVFGNFTDSDGVVHINEPLYTSCFLQGYKNNAERCYGTHITILYDKSGGKIIHYENTIRTITISFALMVLSSVIIIRIKRKNNAASAWTRRFSPW